MKGTEVEKDEAKEQEITQENRQGKKREKLPTKR
jgi:hypothetical protein